MASRPIFGDVIDTSRVRASPLRVDDPFGANARKKNRHHIRLLPSQWASKFIRIKGGDTGTSIPMDFAERKYLLRPYDTPSRKILLLTSRQTEKSTTLGNKLLAMSAMRPMYTSLFVTPSAMQTKVFANARLADIIDISPLIKGLTHKKLVMNILEKEFTNKSKIYLRYAFLTADRIRGLSVNSIFVDEIQDMLWDLMPVIGEASSHHKDRLFVYSGTPKTFDNTIENYWSKYSTQSEWVVPCTRHGLPKDPGSWHWNILGSNNIGKLGPICERCGKGIDPEHPNSRWVQMNPGAEYEGFRICRLMVPWYYKPAIGTDDPHKQWKSILLDRERYPAAQFNNEILAISYDSGLKPLSRKDIVTVCDDAYDMDEDAVAKMAQSHTLYGGIDWGTGEHSWTVLFVGGYTRSDSGFQIVYAKRFTGPLVEPEAQIKELERLIRKFRLKFVGADWGMGFHVNKMLSSTFGPARIHQYQYVVRAPGKLVYKGNLHRFLLFRTPVMADVISAIKGGKIRFPSWRMFETPFADDMLAIRAEYSNTLRMIRYDHPRSVPDDSFHALVYCLMASFFEVRRPDIMAPIRETSAQAGMSAAEDSALEELEYHINQDYVSPVE